MENIQVVKRDSDNIGWRDTNREKLMMKKKIIFTIVLVFIGMLSFGPISSVQNNNTNDDEGMQNTLTDKSRKILNVWATLKIINGVINVLQSAEIGGSFFVEASVNPLEFLAPIDNILDKLSDLLLWALGAIIMEKLLLTISGLLVFKIVIPVCILLCIITIWIKKDKTKITRMVSVFMLTGISISIAIPLSFQLSTVIENKVFTDRVGNLISSINNKGDSAASMENEVTSLKKIGKSILSFMSDAKNLGDALIEDMINFVIIFLVTNIVIPILTIFGIISITKYSAKLILERNP
jgi:hypothetical protein